MGDRELLELAAKAAGLPYIKPLPEYNGSRGLEVGSENPMRCYSWNPLTDDGDALRLAVKLSLTPTRESDRVWVRGTHGTFTVFERYDKLRGGCPYDATRRAIVRAAAEIGKRSNAGLRGRRPGNDQ
jgi:hypothetical protein